MIIGHRQSIPESEREAIELLKVSLRGAIDDSLEISRQIWSGEPYARLSRRLRTVELCCRVISTNRGDARWLPMTLQLAELQQRARRWLTPATVESKRNFALVAKVLEHFHTAMVALETKRPPRSGLILPRPQYHHRETRPVQILMPS